MWVKTPAGQAPVDNNYEDDYDNCSCWRHLRIPETRVVARQMRNRRKATFMIMVRIILMKMRRLMLNEQKVVIHICNTVSKLKCESPKNLGNFL